MIQKRYWWSLCLVGRVTHIDSNKNTEDGSECVLKYRKTITDVERCCTEYTKETKRTRFADPR